ncbi:MAG: acyl carrier protein [Terriglobia bacterium]
MPFTTRIEVLEALTPVFREVLDDSALVLRENMTAADVEGWDSLNHIDLIVAIEKKFKVRFTTSEVTSLKNVGELADLVQTKLATSH